MRKVVSTVLALAFLVTLAAPALAGDDKPKGTPPAAVWKAVTDKYPKAELLDWEKEEEDGKTQYEVEIKVDGKKRELEVTADGKILKDEADDEDDD